MTEQQKKDFEKLLAKSPKDVPYSWSINSLRYIIQSEVEKFVIQKCTKTLEEGEILVVSVEVGDSPVEAVRSFLNGLRERFDAAGLKDVIFTATHNGQGVLTLETIKEEPKGKRGK